MATPLILNQPLNNLDAIAGIKYQNILALPCFPSNKRKRITTPIDKLYQPHNPKRTLMLDWLKAFTLAPIVMAHLYASDPDAAFSAGPRGMSATVGDVRTYCVGAGFVILKKQPQPATPAPTPVTPANDLAPVELVPVGQ